MGLIPVTPTYRRTVSAPSPVPSPAPQRQNGRTSMDSTRSSDSNTNDSQSDTRSSCSESMRLMRTDSKKSKGSSGSCSSMQYSNPGSPDVNININYINLPKDNTPNVHRTNSSNQIVNEIGASSTESYLELNRQQCAALDSELSRIVASDMPRLVQLKLIIAGTKSKDIAESLLPRNTSPVSNSDICTKYKACVMKTDRGYEWIPGTEGKQITQPITKALIKAAQNSLGIDLRHYKLPRQEIHQCSNELREICKNATELIEQSSFEEVDVEVVAMNETPLSTYCGHVLYTAHSMYIIQFDVQDFLRDNAKVLTYIQTQLTKIRTYASDKVQVILVATAQNHLPLKEMKNIGQNLEEHFSSAFCNQLHYNAAINLPCHFVFPHNQLNDLGLGCFSRQESCEDNTSPQSTADLQSSKVKGGNHPQFSYQDRDASGKRILDVEALKPQISTMAFHQRFISKKYPYRYLVYQEQKEKFCKTHQPVGAQKSHILRECRVDDTAGQEALLEYLHDSGNIICIGMYSDK